MDIKNRGGGGLSRSRELRWALTDRASAARLPTDALDVCLFHCVQTGSGTHQALLNGDWQKSLSEVKRL